MKGLGLEEKSEQYFGPVIGFSYTEDFPDDPFFEAVRHLETDKIKVALEKRPSGTMYASLEWLVPTAIFAFVTKAYFEGFLSEAGTKHYILLEAGLQRLFGRFSNVRGIAVASSGKVNSQNPFSRILSIEAEYQQGLVFKLLIQNDLTANEIAAAIEHFLGFVRKFHQCQLDAESQKLLEGYRAKGSRILICFDHSDGALKLIDISKESDPIGGGLKLPSS